jgi:hypothetical protein
VEKNYGGKYYVKCKFDSNSILGTEKITYHYLIGVGKQKENAKERKFKDEERKFKDDSSIYITRIPFLTSCSYDLKGKSQIREGTQRR